MVPLFVNQGDKLKIDTRTGEYLSRINKKKLFGRSRLFI